MTQQFSSYEKDKAETMAIVGCHTSHGRDAAPSGDAQEGDWLVEAQPHTTIQALPDRSGIDSIPVPCWTPSGRYIIHRRLRRSRMATVYTATDTLLGRSVAVNVFDAVWADREADHARILREAQLAARVEHERIVRVYDVGTHEGLVFVVMEYVSGRSLRQWMRKREIQMLQVVKIAVQIAEGLAALHAKGITQGNLKPENLMMTENGDVKLLNLGLAHGTPEFSEGLEPSSLVSTLDCGDVSPDARTDVFSLGAIINELVACVPVFGGKAGVPNSRPEELVVSTTSTRRLRGEAWAYAPPSLREHTARMLAHNPNDRPGGGEQVLGLLRAVAAEISPHGIGAAIEASGENIAQLSSRLLRPTYKCAVITPWRSVLAVLAMPVVLAVVVLPLVVAFIGSNADVTFNWSAVRDASRLDSNLSFEQVFGGKPAGWASDTSYEWRAVGEPRHHGQRSLQVRSRGRTSVGRVYKLIPVERSRGRRLKIHGWIRSEGVNGWAGICSRVTDESRIADQSCSNKVTGTSDWVEVVVEVDVCAECSEVIVELTINDEGTAWFDELEFEEAEFRQSESHAIELAGSVMSPSGEPVSGAEVALVGNGEISAHVQSDVDGRFRFAAQSGKWAISANHPSNVGSFIARGSFDEDVQGIKLVLGASNGIVVRGRVDDRRFSRNAYVLVSPFSGNQEDLFAVPVNSEGRFQTMLPRADEYLAQMIEGGAAVGRGLRIGDAAEIVLR